MTKTGISFNRLLVEMMMGYVSGYFEVPLSYFNTTKSYARRIIYDYNKANKRRFQLVTRDGKLYLHEFSGKFEAIGFNHPDNSIGFGFERDRAWNKLMIHRKKKPLKDNVQSFWYNSMYLKDEFEEPEFTWPDPNVLDNELPDAIKGKKLTEVERIIMD